MPISDGIGKTDDKTEVVGGDTIAGSIVSFMDMLHLSYREVYEEIPYLLLLLMIADKPRVIYLAEGNLDTAVKKVASDLSNFITGSPDADDIINRWQEVTAFLNGITEDKTLSGMLLDLKKQIDESVTAKLADYYTSVRVDELFVKKLVGSRLITEEEVVKLTGLQNYDDTTVKASLQEEINRATEAESNLDAAVKKVASDFATFLSSDPDADDLINRWQEVTAFLQGITEEKTLSGMLLGVKQEINESVTAKLADYYTSARIDDLFVKKLTGSRLITEEETTKLSELQNYDDTAIVDRVNTLITPRSS